MIISHRHKFIFIKTRKTAGTSVEYALAAICGEDDVLTPDFMHKSDADELAREARNWQGRANPMWELIHSRRPIDVARIMRDAWKRPRFYSHMRASAVKARIPARIWRSYYKFGFERNSWDKSISFYHWNHRFRKENEMPSFEDYLFNRKGRTIDQHYSTDWARYTQRDAIIVDRVCDYANLEAELRSALSEAGVPQREIDLVTLPKLKSNIRAGRRKTIYTQRAAEKVADIFRREIKAFNYEIPPHLMVE